MTEEEIELDRADSWNRFRTAVAAYQRGQFGSVKVYCRDIAERKGRDVADLVFAQVKACAAHEAFN